MYVYVLVVIVLTGQDSLKGTAFFQGEKAEFLAVLTGEGKIIPKLDVKTA